VAICPGLAITIVDERQSKEGEQALVMVPFELLSETFTEGSEVTTVDADGEVVGRGVVRNVRDHKSQDRCLLVTVEVPWEDRLEVAGMRVQGEPEAGEPVTPPDQGDPIICRCERVRKSEIVAEIRSGTRDLNQLKAMLRCGMGACGGKTCTPLIEGIFRELGVERQDLTPPTQRPFFAEVPLGLFAGLEDEQLSGDEES
jgi:hypothetical protein